jgi:hypothetical protein
LIEFLIVLDKPLGYNFDEKVLKMDEAVILQLKREKKK